MSMKQLFEYIFEAILRVLCWDVIDRQDFDLTKFLWGLVFVFILGTLLVSIFYKIVACIKRFVSQIKKRKY